MGAETPVAQAMTAVPRAGFLPTDQRGRAGDDRPLPIGEQQTNSQPRTVAAMLELLGVGAGHRVLDVGAGSGWTTALLAHLVGPTGSVLGVELSPALARWGAANLAASGHPWARLREATPGVLGAPDEAPFDRVLVSAEADELPTTLVDQLGSDGVLVIPVAGLMHRVVRPPEGAIVTTTHGAYRFVPLRWARHLP